MAITEKTRILMRRRTAAEWEAINEVLMDGEIGLVSDSSPRKFKIGNGYTFWKDLLYSNDGLPGGSYAGKATPVMNPGAPTNKIFYTISTPGTYTNFGNLTLPEKSQGFISWDGIQWVIDYYTFDLDGYLKKAAVSDYKVIAPAFHDGKYIDMTGSEVSFYNLRYVAMPVPESRKIKVTNTFFGGGIWLAIYKNEAGIVIGREQNGNESTPSIFLGYELNVPIGTAMIFINGNLLDPFKIEVVDSFMVAQKNIQDTIKDSVTDFGAKSITIVDGKYVNSSGSILDGWNYRYTKVEVPPSRRLRVTTRFIGIAVYLAVYVNIRGEVVGYQNQGNESAWSNFEDYEITIPPNAYYVYINNRYEYDLFVFEPQIIKVEPKNDRYKGLRVDFLGDSFVAIGKLPNKLAYELGVSDLLNLGVSGSRITQVEAGDNSFVNRVTAIRPNSDLILILGATNDTFADVPIGMPSDVGKNTFYGALHTILSYIFNTNKVARVAFIIPTQTWKGTLLFPYADAIINVCRIYGVPVLDLSSTGMVNTINLDEKTYDQIHPTDIVFNRMGKVVAEFVKTLM